MFKIVVATLAAIVFVGSPARASEMQTERDFLNAWERENAGFPPREAVDTGLGREDRVPAAAQACRCAAADAPAADRAHVAQPPVRASSP